MITIRGLEKRFGRRGVLAGLNAEFRRGRVTVLTGPNGAGKTTLLKLILGLARAEAGRIEVNGVELRGDPGYRAAIGYMPQIVRFPGQLTGRDLLGMLRSLRKGAVPDLDLAEDLGVGDAMDRPFETLSGGTRQKVNAVLAFAFRPEILILDEPTAGLDPLASCVLKERLAHERASGTTVIITSHVLPELEELADDVVFLDGGRVRWSGSANELRSSTGQPSLERAVASLLRPEGLRIVA